LCTPRGAYKPDRRPYEHVLAQLAVDGSQATLIAAHAWDVVGAKQAGLGAVWVDRLEHEWPFPKGKPRRTASNLEQAAALVLERMS
jgi:2-haloacid dehalogenase